LKRQLEPRDRWAKRGRIMNKVSALSVLSNAVLVWNTVRIGQIVDALAASGHAVARDVLARISPLAHVIPSGTYHFGDAKRALA
jgi:Tn3 transposase DDE domain